jgi:hypothetical protein
MEQQQKLRRKIVCLISAFKKLGIKDVVLYLGRKIVATK